eukprot:UN27657
MNIGGANEESEEVENDFVVHTFGYGKRHRSDLLGKISEAYGGLYYYIQSKNQIEDCFASCMSGLESTVAKNIKINIRPRCKRVRILSVSDNQSSSNQTITCTIPNLFSEEEKHVLISCKVKPKKSVKFKDVKNAEGARELLSNFCKDDQIADLYSVDITYNSIQPSINNDNTEVPGEVKKDPLGAKLKKRGTKHVLLI